MMPVPHPTITTGQKQVAILIDPDDSWGRRVILSISAAAQHIPSWDLLIAPKDDQWRLRVPPKWKGDGLIVAVRDDKTADHVRSLGVPVVHVSLCERTQDSRFRVITDDRKRAEMALEHFRERGIQNFAYYGPSSQRYPKSRGETFRDVVTAAGFFCHLFQPDQRRRESNAVRDQTIRWLRQLPRPVGILTADPYPALQLTQYCRAIGMSIPEELAILAGDTDDVLCGISSPPLSSIVLGCEQIGLQSVHMLQTLFAGNIPEHPFHLVPPIRVELRHSTDMLAIDDPVLVKALQFIREHAFQGIQVGDILNVVPVSRRLLELRFHQYLQRSPADEIRRVRLERVKKLLIETDQTIEQIAALSGFSSASQLGTVFHRTTDLTPMEYRKANRS